jgi:hypothetical protein
MVGGTVIAEDPKRESIRSGMACAIQRLLTSCAFQAAEGEVSTVEIAEPSRQMPYRESGRPDSGLRRQVSFEQPDSALVPRRSFQVVALH